MSLHTHMVMSVILALTAAAMYIHLVRLQVPVKAGKWLKTFYLSLLIWQLENVVRYSVPLSYYSTIPYKIQTVFVLVPTVAISLVCHTQYAYRFLIDLYKKERVFVLKLSVALSILEILFVAYNEFVQNLDIGTTLISVFFFSTFFTIWLIILSLRKARHLKTIAQKASVTHFIYAGINMCYLLAAIFSIIFGFFSKPGFWSYFSFVWLGNLASIVLYISSSAVPASFQTKITGFTYVLAASFLTIITLTLYPPVPFTDMEARLAQQYGLKRLVLIIVVIAFMIVTLMPFMLKYSLTRRLTSLLSGVQSVNSGNLDTTVEVGLKDELGSLAENFNQMTGNLKVARQELTEYAQNLEKKVLRRTAQLQTSLTELKAIQAQLIQAEKLASLGELTSGIAHEIKNPLNFINNFSEVSRELCDEMEEELNAAEPDAQNMRDIISDIKGNLEKINTHGRRANGIVEGMLEHSRASKGQSQQTDINALAREQMEECYRHLLSKKKTVQAKLEMQFDEKLTSTVAGDGTIQIMKQDVGRVLSNLFTNAFYSVTEKKDKGFAGYEPVVQVSTKLLQDKIEICVADNGLGISPAIVNKIFQPFFTTKPSGEGTGLGLSLSYDIVKAHGGELKVDSIPGEYAKFIVDLPVAQTVNHYVLEEED